MSARFEFATATRIVFGRGTLQSLGTVAAELGKRALIVTGSHPERAKPVVDQLEKARIQACLFSIHGEPTTPHVCDGVKTARDASCDLIIAFGGGSAIDAAKAIGALLANGGQLLDYLEVIGQAKPLLQPSVPVIAIPTTAGTGCEVTKNAVLASPEHRFKVSLRSPFLLPKVALVDPELTFSLPASVTSVTGMGALTQLIEPFVSPKANPMTDALCLDGIQRAARSLRRACNEPANGDAREDMALASLYSGMALANAGLGAVHGFAAPLGGMFNAPHGAICAALLPHVMQQNIEVLSRQFPGHLSLERYLKVAQLLTGRSDASLNDGIGWVTTLCADLSIPRLRNWGIRENDIPLLAEKASQASSMKANPVTFDRSQLENILQKAL